MSLPNKVPSGLKQYFWDVDFEHVDPSEKPLFVIQRLLDKGDLQAVKWVYASFPKELIVETFFKMRDFSPRVGVFWQAFLGIPLDQVACLQTHYRQMRQTHWSF